MNRPELELFKQLQSMTMEKIAASVEERPEPKGEPEEKAPVSLRNLFTHPDAHPIVLNMALLKAFDVEWLAWEPDTIWVEIQKTFGSHISQHNRTKVQTVKTLQTVPSPWHAWQVFEKIVQGLNGNLPRWELMQAPSLPHLFAAVDMMGTIHQFPFSDEVKAYMACAVLHEEVVYVPAPLDFIQVEVSRPYYECLDCGNCDSALFHDGLCDTCTHKFDPENGLSMRPSPEMLEAKVGRNLELHLSYPPDEVEKKWKTVEHSKAEDTPLEENEVDVQIAKLLMARDYMLSKRKQLADQLVALKSWMGAV